MPQSRKPRITLLSQGQILWETTEDFVLLLYPGIRPSPHIFIFNLGNQYRYRCYFEKKNRWTSYSSVFYFAWQILFLKQWFTIIWLDCVLLIQPFTIYQNSLIIVVNQQYLVKCIEHEMYNKTTLLRLIEWQYILLY